MIQEDPVREVTAPQINASIDREAESSIRYYAARPRHELDGRIAELEREWDIERWLETNASVLALGGVALGVLRNRLWLGLPVVVASFLLQHAIRGWCPPVPVFRRLGVRTRKEIDHELYSLRVLRGDFAHLVRRANADDEVPALPLQPDADKAQLGAVPT